MCDCKMLLLLASVLIPMIVLQRTSWKSLSHAT